MEFGDSQRQFDERCNSYHGGLEKIGGLMGLCLGHESALRYWLTKTGDEVMPEHAPSSSFARAEARLKIALSEHLPIEPEKGRPLHLVVSNRRLGHALDGVIAHVWSGKLPNGALCELSGDNTVTSPELTFVQMAARLSLVEAIEIGDYLCSTFSVEDAGRGYAGEREQLTSVESLRDFIDALPPGSYGIRKARAALEHVVDGLASPMEVFLGMSLGLPADLGGRGPFLLHANQVIDIDAHIQRLLGARYLKGDLYLPEFNADVEFDSYTYHTGSYRLDHTQARRNALEAMGIKTISATYGQVKTLELFDEFVWMLRRRLGLDHPTYSYEERQAQMALHDLLLSPGRRLF